MEPIPTTVEMMDLMRPRSESFQDTSSCDESTSSHSHVSVNIRKTKRRARGRKRSTNASIPDKHMYLAMDCEMVGTGKYGHTSTLARVTILNWNEEIVYDTYVRPRCDVTDYRTFVSGITPEQLAQAPSFEEVQTRVQQLVEDRIVVGHALKNDLKALELQHPWYLTRDTAKYEPFMKMRFDDGILWPRKLAELCQEHLGRDIQPSMAPHSPYMDALGALDLYKKNRSKWEKVIAYKMSRTKEIEATKTTTE